MFVYFTDISSNSTAAHSQEEFHNPSYTDDYNRIHTAKENARINSMIAATDAK